MQLEIILLNGMSQPQKDKRHMFSLICGSCILWRCMIHPWVGMKKDGREIFQRNKENDREGGMGRQIQSKHMTYIKMSMDCE